MRDMGNIIGMIAIFILGAGYLWSFVLGYRKSVAWLLGLLFFWLFAYPALVLTSWDSMKHNFTIVGLGFLLFAIWMAILSYTNPNVAIS